MRRPSAARDISARWLVGRGAAHGRIYQLDEGDDMQVEQMMSTHPQAPRNANDALHRCIEQCYSCAQTCTACADACLAEEAVARASPMHPPEPRLRRPVRDDRPDRHPRHRPQRGAAAEIINLCALICRMCAAECDRHAGASRALPDLRRSPAAAARRRAAKRSVRCAAID